MQYIKPNLHALKYEHSRHTILHMFRHTRGPIEVCIMHGTYSIKTHALEILSRFSYIQNATKFGKINIANTPVGSTLITITVQQDATQSSLYIILQVHSTCFGCQPHPSSGVHKTVTTVSGTGHIFCAATSLQRVQVRTATLAAQYRRL